MTTAVAVVASILIICAHNLTQIFANESVRKTHTYNVFKEIVLSVCVVHAYFFGISVNWFCSQRIFQVKNMCICECASAMSAVRSIEYAIQRRAIKSISILHHFGRKMSCILQFCSFIFIVNCSHSGASANEF